jgi:hypothetical protein
MADNPDDVAKRLRSYTNPAILGPFTDALLASLAAGDSMNEMNLLAAKPQMFLATATSTFLDRLFAKIGITRPAGVGIDDTLFRQMGIAITANKLVRNIFLEVLEIFYGLDAVRANVLSGTPEGYVLSNGMTLDILVDNNKQPLTVTFTTADFTDISDASALEISNVISTTAFNAGYTLTASVFNDNVNNENFVQLLSGTRGPLSAITVVGGSAQNILNFPQRSTAVPQLGTQFSTSFVGQYVRFTWTAGPSPLLEFVSPGDYVNIYGAQYLSSNQGTFTVQDLQDGPVNSAYFDIINPNFTPQGSVTLTAVGGASGYGLATTTAVAVQAPTGAVRVSGVSTITTASPHGFSAGQTVTVAGVDNTSFNGTFTIVSATTYTFSYDQLGANSQSGNGQASVSYQIQHITGAVRVSGVSTITLTQNHNLQVGQLITITGVNDSSFDGTFSIVSVGANSFTYSQTASNDLVFFTPTRQTIQNQPRYASVYEVNPYEVVIFLPATTQIIKRSLIGAWHVHSGPTDHSFIGSYSFDSTSGFPVTGNQTILTQDIQQGSIKTVGFGSDTTSFPDSTGYLVFEYGTSNQEGPVKYLGRPSDGSWLLDPSYKFQKTHLAGSSVNLIAGRSPYQPKTDGTDYQAFVTGTVTGRIAATKLIQSLTASGIFLNVIIVYPEGPGIQNLQGVVYAGDPA